MEIQHSVSDETPGSDDPMWEALVRPTETFSLPDATNWGYRGLGRFRPRRGSELRRENPCET